jgi:hypothetical protein
MGAKDLLLDAIATNENLTPVPIPEIPRLDGKIYVRVMNAGERHLFGAVAIDARKDNQFISDYETVAICACEADGTPMFHAKDDTGRITINAEDVNRLRLVDGRAIHAIAKMAWKVSGMEFGSDDAAKKNSVTTPTSESSSA